MLPPQASRPSCRGSAGRCRRTTPGQSGLRNAAAASLSGGATGWPRLHLTSTIVGGAGEKEAKPGEGYCSRTQTNGFADVEAIHCTTALLEGGCRRSHMPRFPLRSRQRSRGASSVHRGAELGAVDVVASAGYCVVHLEGRQGSRAELKIDQITWAGVEPTASASPDRRLQPTDLPDVLCGSRGTSYSASIQRARGEPQSVSRALQLRAAPNTVRALSVYSGPAVTAADSDVGIPACICAHSPRLDHPARLGCVEAWRLPTLQALRRCGRQRSAYPLHHSQPPRCSPPGTTIRPCGPRPVTLQQCATRPGCQATQFPWKLVRCGQALRLSEAPLNDECIPPSGLAQGRPLCSATSKGTDCRQVLAGIEPVPLR